MRKEETEKHRVLRIAIAWINLSVHLSDWTYTLWFFRAKRGHNIARSPEPCSVRESTLVLARMERNRRRRARDRVKDSVSEVIIWNLLWSSLFLCLPIVSNNNKNLIFLFFHCLSFSTFLTFCYLFLDSTKIFKKNLDFSVSMNF